MLKNISNSNAYLGGDLEAQPVDLKAWFEDQLQGKSLQRAALEKVNTDVSAIRYASDIMQVWPDFELPKRTLEAAAVEFSGDSPESVANYVGICAALKFLYGESYGHTFLQQTLVGRVNPLLEGGGVSGVDKYITPLAIAISYLDFESGEFSGKFSTTVKNLFETAHLEDYLIVNLNGHSDEMSLFEKLSLATSFRLFDPEHFGALGITEEHLHSFLLGLKEIEDVYLETDMASPDYPLYLNMYRILTADSVRLIPGKGIEVSRTPYIEPTQRTPYEVPAIAID